MNMSDKDVFSFCVEQLETYRNCNTNSEVENKYNLWLKEVLERLTILNCIKPRLEIKSLFPYCEDICVKNTSEIVVFNENEHFEEVKCWIKNK